MRSNFLRWTSISYLICASAAVSADEFAYVLPLFKDLSPTPGDELTITPLLSWVDSDADNYPNRLKLAFNVWDAGTNTRVRQTEAQWVYLPPLPCANPGDWDDDIRIKFMGASSASRVHMLLEFEAECEDFVTFEYRNVYKTFWYSADVAITGDSYAKAWADWEVMGANSVDYDDDGDTELQLVLVKETAAGDQSRSRVIYMDWLTGTEEAANTYTIEYYNY